MQSKDFCHAVFRLLQSAKSAPELAMIYSMELDRILRSIGYKPISFSAIDLSYHSKAFAEDLGISHLFSSTATYSTGVIAEAEKLVAAGKRSEAIAVAFREAAGPEVNGLNLLFANCANGTSRISDYFVDRYLTAYGLTIGPLRRSNSEIRAELSYLTDRNVLSEPIISVIVPAFNVQATLEISVRSILAQSVKGLEILIVDDASTDATSAIAKQLAKVDPRVKVVSRSSHLGFQGAVREAVSLARTQWVCIHSALNWAFPNRLEAQLAGLKGAGAQCSVGGGLERNSRGHFISNSVQTCNHEDVFLRFRVDSLMAKRDCFLDFVDSWAHEGTLFPQFNHRELAPPRTDFHQLNRPVSISILELSGGWQTDTVHLAIDEMKQNGGVPVKNADTSQTVEVSLTIQRLNLVFAKYDLVGVRWGRTNYSSHVLTPSYCPLVVEGPLVSVLIAVRNAKSTLEEVVQSVLAQSWRNVEVLMLDDGSDDDSWSVMQSICLRDERVKIFRSEVMVGSYVAMNLLLAQAKGEWIVEQRADEWAHPERIAKQVQLCLIKDAVASLGRVFFGVGRARAGEQLSIEECCSGENLEHSCYRLIVNAQFLRDVLGGWDHVVEGGGDEIVRRIEVVDRKTRKVPVFEAPLLFARSFFQPTVCEEQQVGIRVGNIRDMFAEYEVEYSKWHRSITRASARLCLEAPCPFNAPVGLRVPDERVCAAVRSIERSGISMGKRLRVDVAIVTNTRFPGGNASSTLDELAFLKERGFKYAIVHSPSDGTLGKPISSRYVQHLDQWHNWSQVASLEANVLICRHPSTVTSTSFAWLLPKIRTEHAFVVKNNSKAKVDGTQVYDMERFIRVASEIDASSLTFCPISPVMREELEEFRTSSGLKFVLSEADWTPTFDLTLYVQQPKDEFRTPFTIGRHGRDGAEKWHESSECLLQAYPDAPEFAICILGGAKRAEEILGELPDNWEVLEFGAIEPFDYLKSLDVFVYFPNSALAEGFGRTIVEAMLAGVPVILPPRFSVTFGDLPIYCEPADVAGIIRQLAVDDRARVQYLLELQDIAIERYSSGVIAKRLEGTALFDADCRVRSNVKVLSKGSLNYKASLLGG